MPIYLKTKNEVEDMRVACQMAADTLLLVGEVIRPGMSTQDLDDLVAEDTKKKGGICAPLNYKGTGQHAFPKSICTSINDVVCHGIPSSTVFLKDGDIINVDVTTIFNGWHGDTSATFFVGTPSPEAKRLVEITQKCLELGIAEVKPGKRLGDIGAAIQTYAESQGCSLIRDFGGHGVGRIFHEEPFIRHFGTRGAGQQIHPGMVFTIEPMVNLGKCEWGINDEDHWTIFTVDGKLSAQFEHTIAVTATGHDILTKRSKLLKNSIE